MKDLNLTADFPAATREQWLHLVQGVLKGGDFGKRLVSRTHDGLSIEPLYPKAEGQSAPSRGAHSPWRIAQRVDHPDPSAANELALADLQGGADALTLVFAGAPTSRGFGLEVRTVDDLDRALQGVRLDWVQLRLEAGSAGRQAAAFLVALAERRGHALADLDFDLGLDPLGSLAAQGRLSAAWEIVAARSADTLAGLSERGFNGRVFLADGRPYNEAGAGEAQELAVVLATGVAYLRALESGGYPLEGARDALGFLLVADANEFLTMAKFRALRILWARVEAACGLGPKPIRLHAETAWRMTTRRDPWVNLLRGTVAAFSAGIGGADSVGILPLTTALGLPDAFARRMARNTQLILLEESNLWRVADPAAGAGGFEALTDGLCHQAWDAFQEIEREGGIVESLRAGALQTRIAVTRAEREKATARRKDAITGVSEFPNLGESGVSVLMTSAKSDQGEGERSFGEHRNPSPEAADAASTSRLGRGGVPSFAELIARAGAGAGLADLAPPPGSPAISIVLLPSSRTAEPFERLRDISDATHALVGARPRVFLANLGPVAAFTARATFTKNLFEAGGVEALANEGFASLEALVEAYKASGAKLACLCSSDKIYSTQAVEAAQALARAGASRIYLAGRPGDLAEPLGLAGVNGYIHTGCDALEMIEGAINASA